MSLSLRIALRYLVARKSHGAVNIISLISMIGVALAVAAMVVVMSVFNGFADFTASKVTALEADLTVEADSGKVIDDAVALSQQLGQIEGVAQVSPVIQERAFAIHGNNQSPVTLRGIDPDSEAMAKMRGLIIDGEAFLGDYFGYEMSLMSVGATNALRAAPSGEYPVKIYEPRRTGRINPANPMRAFRADSVLVAGVFRTDTESVDADMVIVPFYMAQRLLDYDKEASFVEITLIEGADVGRVKADIASVLSAGMSVKEPIERQAEAFKMINMEKWVTLLMLTFILVIATFNILSTLGVIIVEKRSNMAVMRSFGAPVGMNGRIFGWLGALVTMAGGVAGLVIGTGITLLQQYCGIVKMAVSDPTMLALEVYPVRLIISDLPILLAVVALVALLSALIISRVARLMSS